MTSAYALHSPLFLTGNSFGVAFLHDAPTDERKNELEFHVESGDYFGTLATIMGLMADSISSNASGARERCVKTLNELREDLSYLHENYTIRSK